MPITWEVDHARRLVLAKASGVMQGHEVREYQTTVWSRPDIAGYDELVDMTDVQEIALTSASRARELASISAEMDRPAPADGPDRPPRFAIVAPNEIAFAMGKMYETFRQMEPKSMKEVRVFRTRAEALRFLGVAAPVGE
ncbi:MAG: hypothetical protein HY076_02275 [Candidatus Eisenbacteria bacterium]|uniref:STAS/SEC14 domain-containing protein n=1 Tax=Eiseniibacteriota bacterium TaxID=2212470 RepID=A0A9D6L568_UNCEI|nr:hypothetical protein [Candidatus Eisenbacteria bacterium]MBI3539083.1 hypothetical protein [Candidatus Eisenbacteria bacterium]